jgi:serine/threonine protein kinase
MRSMLNGLGSSQEQLSAEQAFGRYTLLKKLAQGGMAEVWLAKQRGPERFEKKVVIKRILPKFAGDSEFREMFLNEARIAAQFSHPNIVQIYDMGEVAGSYYIAMEYVNGQDLGRVIRRVQSLRQQVPPPIAIRIIALCCEGLYYAHNRADDAGRPLKVIHRDISPQNILVGFDGSVKLVDFGIAKAVDSAAMTKSGHIKGKLSYMAPEQPSSKTSPSGSRSTRCSATPGRSSAARTRPPSWRRWPARSRRCGSSPRSCRSWRTS